MGLIQMIFLDFQGCIYFQGAMLIFRDAFTQAWKCSNFCPWTVRFGVHEL